MAVVRPRSVADAMRACVRARAGSKPAREPSRAMGQAGSARDGEPRFRVRDPHVQRRPIVARREGVRTSALCARRSRDFFPFYRTAVGASVLVSRENRIMPLRAEPTSTSLSAPDACARSSRPPTDKKHDANEPAWKRSWRRGPIERGAQTAVGHPPPPAPFLHVKRPAASGPSSSQLV